MEKYVSADFRLGVAGFFYQSGLRQKEHDGGFQERFVRSILIAPPDNVVFIASE